jgi:hypothetical protein
MRLALASPVGTLAVIAALAILPGCALRASPPVVGGYATVYADTVPDDIYAYPHVWYDGGYAYLVGTRWFYPSGGGWVVLRTEPAPLYRYRASYGYRGYPGYGRTFRQAAPPAPPAYRGYPPPAQRVR